MNPLFSAR